MADLDESTAAALELFQLAMVAEDDDDDFSTGMLMAAQMADEATQATLFGILIGVIREQNTTDEARSTLCAYVETSLLEAAGG